MSNVKKLYQPDAAKNPDNVLEQAIGVYDSVFVIGIGKDGLIDARASTNITREQILWMLEKFKFEQLFYLSNEHWK